MAWDLVLILAILGIVVPWRGARCVKRILQAERLSSADRVSIYAATIAFQWLATAVVVWRWLAHGGSGAALGLTLPEPLIALALGAGLTIALCALQVGSLRRLVRQPREKQGILGELIRKFMPQNPVESLAFVALVVTVALCEEILYRGFAFAFLAEAVDGRVMVGVLGSAVLFGIAHLYQGRRGIAVTFMVGLIFGFARMWSQSLAPSITAHLFTDLLAGLAGPAMLAAAERGLGTQEGPLA